MVNKRKDNRQDVTQIFAFNMDYRSRELSWTARADTAFARDHSAGAESSHKSEIKRSLRNLLQKRSRVWWNKITLKKYLAHGLIPRGLRVQVFPSFPVTNDSFKEKWEAACTTCSRVFLQLLVGHNLRTLQYMEPEIEELSSKIRTDLSIEEFNQWNQELDTWFKDWESKIESTKIKKFQRDLQDLQLNRMYRWKHEQSALLRTTSMSSVSPAGAQSGASSGTSSCRRFAGNRHRMDYSQQQGERRQTRQQQNQTRSGPPLKQRHSFVCTQVDPT
ncbi:uncharacterized protein LOC130273443 [Hyla sarda]|uniref:uncharacterized protein LOC130273443 n=1 Tax=Hyla sarda TaxID=327740 RepID=UPI0024C27A84|nr:uncharacterized protein LOC130273443 [Hyla sarda]